MGKASGVLGGNSTSGLTFVHTAKLPSCVVKLLPLIPVGLKMTIHKQQRADILQFFSGIGKHFLKTGSMENKIEHYRVSERKVLFLAF